MDRKRRIAILGSTGSIGTQTLDVIRQHRDKFEVELLTCNTSVELLAKQAAEFDANNAVICDETLYPKLSSLLGNTDTKAFAGIKSVCDLVASDNVDIVVGAMVGFSGLKPTLSAIKAGKIIALANKETLVAAGGIVTSEAQKRNAPIIPVDSEHSAIFQCLLSAQGNKIAKIHLTASGGPFRTWDKDRIAKATKDDALRHPNWNMGAKVTIDSSTMMNKGFEVIEAKWLFGQAVSKINVVIQPESIIHSMIEYEDGAVMAQLAFPDMREPIQFAIGFPKRMPLDNKKLDFAELRSISFFKPDMDKFPCLGLAYKAIEIGGNIPCALNAANESAVDAFLRGRIGFYDIPYIINECMEKSEIIKEPTLDDIFMTNAEVRRMAGSMIENMEK